MILIMLVKPRSEVRSVQPKRGPLGHPANAARVGYPLACLMSMETSNVHARVSKIAEVEVILWHD